MNPDLKILASGDSPEAKKIYRYVSPIYKGEVSQALFQAIGEVLDDMENIVESFYLQISPYTSDWLLGLWEKEYGLKTVSGMPYEQRKKRLMTSTTANSTFTPYGLKKFLEKYVDGKIEIIENTDDNEFGVRIFPRGTVDTAWLKEILDKKKQAHLNYTLLVASQPSLAIRARLKTFRTGSTPMCGLRASDGSCQLYTGMRPYVMQRCAICSTLSSVQAKVVSLTGLTVIKGTSFTVFFENECATNTVTINLNGTNYNVTYGGSSAIPETGMWSAKTFVGFYYDGTNMTIQTDSYFTEQCTIAINIDGELIQNVESLVRNMND